MVLLLLFLSMVGAKEVELKGRKCETSIYCYDVKGLVFIPSHEENQKIFNFTPPNAKYKKIVVRMKVTNFGWNGYRPSGLHNIFYFRINKHKDMIGYVNVQGPNKDLLMFRHGMKTANADKSKAIANFKMNTMWQYEFVYIYNVKRGFVRLIVRDADGKVALRFKDQSKGIVEGFKPNIEELITHNDKFQLMISFIDGVQPHELVTFGWLYEDLKIRMFYDE